MSIENVHVVVGFDFTASARAALQRAIGVGTRAPWHVLHFVCVLERADIAEATRQQERVTEAIRDALTEAKVDGKVHFFVHVHIGKPADEILRVAQDVGADLIIVGSKGLTGLERAVLGSVSEKVVREAGCTVEVAREKTYPYVALLDVVEKEKHAGYVPPHRYTYEDSRVTLRPNEWPLY
ncbi:MAG TPA: universal stress protein [Kofleriaceae bacterium]|nr:universal stress protein [Kofleriaceae bacterium]